MLLTPEKRCDFWFLSNSPINMSAFWSSQPGKEVWFTPELHNISKNTMKRVKVITARFPNDYKLTRGEETVLCARLAHPWVPFRWVPHSSGAALNAPPPRQVGIKGQTPWNKIHRLHGTKRQMQEREREIIGEGEREIKRQAITCYGRGHV